MRQKYSDIRKTLEEVTGLIISELESSEKRLEMLEDRISELERMLAAGRQAAAGDRDSASGIPVSYTKPESETADVGIAPEDGVAVTEVSGKESEEDGAVVLGELFTVPKAIGDTARDVYPWYTDMPGDRVEDVNLAISLNDRLFFIRELFFGDDIQFQLMMDRINESSSFEEVLADMRTAFPEWDEESEPVYRFYMAVRRRFV